MEYTIRKYYDSNWIVIGGKWKENFQINIKWFDSDE